MSPSKRPRPSSPFLPPWAQAVSLQIAAADAPSCAALTAVLGHLLSSARQRTAALTLAYGGDDAVVCGASGCTNTLDLDGTGWGMCWLCVAEDEDAAREICVDCGIRCAGGCVGGEVDLLCRRHRRELCYGSDCEVALCNACVGKCGGCEADECGGCLSGKGGSSVYCKDCLEAFG